MAIKIKERDWYIGRFIEQVGTKNEDAIYLGRDEFEFSMTGTLVIPKIYLTYVGTWDGNAQNGVVPGSSSVLIYSGDVMLVFAVGEISKKNLLRITRDPYSVLSVDATSAQIQECRIVEGIKLEWYNLFRRGFGYSYQEALEMAHGPNGRPDQPSDTRAKEWQV